MFDIARLANKLGKWNLVSFEDRLHATDELVHDRFGPPFSDVDF
jgi:hypothetical protein